MIDHVWFYDVQIFNLLTTFLPQICKKNLSSAISEWSASKTGPDAPTCLRKKISIFGDNFSCNDRLH